MAKKRYVLKGKNVQRKFEQFLESIGYNDETGKRSSGVMTDSKNMTRYHTDPDDEPTARQLENAQRDFGKIIKKDIEDLLETDDPIDILGFEVLWIHDGDISLEFGMNEGDAERLKRKLIKLGWPEMLVRTLPGGSLGIYFRNMGHIGKANKKKKITKNGVIGSQDDEEVIEEGKYIQMLTKELKTFISNALKILSRNEPIPDTIKKKYSQLNKVVSILAKDADSGKLKEKYEPRAIEDNMYKLEKVTNEMKEELLKSYPDSEEQINMMIQSLSNAFDQFKTKGSGGVIGSLRSKIQKLFKK